MKVRFIHFLLRVAKKTGFNILGNACLLLLRYNDDDYNRYFNNICKHPKTSCLRSSKVSINEKYDLLIIVPCYNVEDYVKECIDSIINQGVRYSILLYIINDGSTDSTGKILQHYAELSIKNFEIKIINQPNMGSSGARNKGLEDVCSKYIMFVDGDDKLADGSINRLLDIAEEKDADIVEGRYYTFSRKKISMNPLCLTGFVWNKIYNAKLWKEIIFNIDFIFEDTINNIMIYPDVKNYITVDVPTTYYRVNGGGVTFSTRGSSRVLHTLYITEQLLSDRFALGRSFNDISLDRFLRQVKCNMERLFFYNDEKLIYYSFLFHMDLYNKYYKGMNSIKFKELCSSLQKKDYYSFIKFSFL